MMGSVGSWLYKYLLGILPDIERPGFEEFHIKPYIPAALAACQGTYQSIRGEVGSAWRKERGKLHLDVKVPGNSVAKVYVPTTNAKSLRIDGKPFGKHALASYEGQTGDFAVFSVPSGEYRFESAWRE